MQVKLLQLYTILYTPCCSIILCLPFKTREYPAPSLHSIEDKFILSCIFFKLTSKDFELGFFVYPDIDANFIELISSDSLYILLKLSRMSFATKHLIFPILSVYLFLFQDLIV